MNFKTVSKVAAFGLTSFYCGRSWTVLRAEQEQATVKPKLPMVYFIVGHQNTFLGTIVMQLRSDIVVLESWDMALRIATFTGLYLGLWCRVGTWTGAGAP